MLGISQLPSFSLFLALVLIGPIVEEYIFRYLLLRRVFVQRLRMTQRSAVAASAVCSTLIHVPELVNTRGDLFSILAPLVLILISMSVYSAAYVSTMKLHVPIIMHAVHNAYAILPTPQLNNVFAGAAETLVLGAALGAAGLLLFTYQWKKFRSTAPND
jgi:membrane protease YdiL (CAAX protease family)